MANQLWNVATPNRLPRCAHNLRRTFAVLAYFRDQIDLYARPEGDLCHAERASGVFAPIAKHLCQQLGGTVGNKMLLSKPW